MGVQAIPIVSLITFLFGLILALQTAHELKKFGMVHLVADTVVVAILRELGPLLTAIVVIGRSGSAFAAEIGTKKVTEEVDALRTMAFDPVGFLVAPKFLAMLVMVSSADDLGRPDGSRRRKRFWRGGREFHFSLVLQAIAGRDRASGRLHRSDQERCLRDGDHGRRLPRRFCHRGGRRGGRPIDYFGRGDFDFSGGDGGSGVYDAVLCDHGCELRYDGHSEGQPGDFGGESPRQLWRARDSSRDQFRRAAGRNAGDSGRLRIGKEYAAADAGRAAEADVG